MRKNCAYSLIVVATKLVWTFKLNTKKFDPNFKSNKIVIKRLIYLFKIVKIIKL